MAKLKAPLLSLGASGAIGKSIVFFPWKGLDVAREYVVPANPKTTAQNTQRGYLRTVVSRIHFLQGLAGAIFAQADATSYALLGSLMATPRTWFNTVAKSWMYQKSHSLIPAVYTAGSCVAGSLKLTLTLIASQESSAITNGVVVYGTSKSALINSHACTYGELEAGVEITPLIAGTKYYCQFRPTLPITFLGTNSGIWYATPTA